MNRHTKIFFLAGAAGQIECALDLPENAPRGIALIAHPHPLYGGTMDNKVVATLGRAFVGVGFAVARMNFRGVGQTQGQHDQGRGETDDMALLLTYMKQQYPGLPVVLGGFSFGTFVQASLQQRLTEQGEPAERLILISATAGKWSPPPVPANTILVQGDMDDTILLKDVLDWARPQDIPVIVVPGCDHLFNRKLHHLRQIVTDTWRA
ncbi:MAG: alpha/beta hydrolase [Burkholderiaceae bacterium]|nr:alpha/beta hydrolase [Burkholderiaceae bacterium]